MGPSHLTAVTPPSKKKKGGKTHHRKPSVSYGRQAEQQHLLSQESTSSTPDTAWTALHFLIHQSSASPANLMCPSPLMKTATQTCPAVSQGCVGGGEFIPLPASNPASSPQGADAIKPKHTEEIYAANSFGCSFPVVQQIRARSSPLLYTETKKKSKDSPVNDFINVCTCILHWRLLARRASLIISGDGLKKEAMFPWCLEQRGDWLERSFATETQNISKITQLDNTDVQTDFLKAFPQCMSQQPNPSHMSWYWCKYAGFFPPPRDRH